MNVVVSVVITIMIIMNPRIHTSTPPISSISFQCRIKKKKVV